MPAIPLVAAGLSAAGAIGGAKIASNAQGKAQKAQLSAIDQAKVPITNAYNTGRQALGQAYQTQQQNLNPYQQLGQQALGALGSRMGLGNPSSMGGVISMPGSSGVVQVKAPNGQVYHVPQAQVQQAVAAGGQVIQ